MRALIGPEYLQRLPALMEGATHHLRVALFQMRAVGKGAKSTSGELVLKLVAKAREGKRVRVLLSSAGGGKAIPAVNREAARWLAEGGVEVRNLGAWRVCHAKLVIVDDRVMVVGSHNWSPSSLTRNFEVSVLIDDHELVGRLLGYYDTLWTVAKQF